MRPWLLAHHDTERSTNETVGDDGRSGGTAAVKRGGKSGVRGVRRTAGAGRPLSSSHRRFSTDVGGDSSWGNAAGEVRRGLGSSLPSGAPLCVRVRRSNCQTGPWAPRSTWDDLSPSPARFSGATTDEHPLGNVCATWQREHQASAQTHGGPAARTHGVSGLHKRPTSRHRPQRRKNGPRRADARQTELTGTPDEASTNASSVGR